MQFTPKTISKPHYKKIVPFHRCYFRINEIDRLVYRNFLTECRENIPSISSLNRRTVTSTLICINDKQINNKKIKIQPLHINNLKRCARLKTKIDEILTFCIWFLEKVGIMLTEAGTAELLTQVTTWATQLGLTEAPSIDQLTSWSRIRRLRNVITVWGEIDWDHGKCSAMVFICRGMVINSLGWYAMQYNGNPSCV